MLHPVYGLIQNSTEFYFIYLRRFSKSTKRLKFFLSILIKHHFRSPLFNRLRNWLNNLIKHMIICTKFIFR